MISILFWFFALPLFLFSHSAITENDPSTLVAGVSVITGDYYHYDEVFRVDGCQPCDLKVHYIGSDGEWGVYNHQTSQLNPHKGEIFVREENGTVIKYQNSGWYGCMEKLQHKSRHHPKRAPPPTPEWFRFEAKEFAHEQGVSNTARGPISGQTDLRTQYLELHVTTDVFVLHASNGTKRVYRKSILGDDFKTGITKVLYYHLASEELLNGNKIEYKRRYDGYKKIEFKKEYFSNGYIPDELMTIRSSNRQGTKTYAQIDIPLDSKSEISIGNDHRQSSFVVHQTLKNLTINLKNPDRPEQHFYHERRLRRITHKPDHRALEILYDGHDKVKALAVDSPRGLINLYEFEYDFPNRTSIVFDAEKNPTRYFWDENLRLKQIEYPSGKKEKFVWNGIQLHCKSIYDHDTPIIAYTYTYDDKGNPTEEIIWGNLSGRGPPLQIDRLPLDNGVEKAVTTRTFTQDGKNLLLRQEDPNGLITLIDYIEGTNLPKSKSVSDRKQTLSKTIYNYDDDLVLIEEIIEEPNFRTLKKISPKQSSPYINMPELIEEKYYDFSEQTEKTLRKTKLHYSTVGGYISHKEIYDKDDAHRYTLAMTYNSQGKIETATNPISQKSEYRYDSSGNCLYTKSYDGQLETFMKYDHLNRLIEKEEKGETSRIWSYAYDDRDCLTAETDPYGNVTKHEYDSSRNQCRTYLPSFQNENGEWIHPIICRNFDSLGRMIEITDPEGHLTRTSYNILGKPTRIDYPDGTHEENIYNPDGTHKEHIDPVGRSTFYEYDVFGQLIRKAIENLSEETYFYLGHRLTKKIDAEGNITQIEYDGAGRKIKETQGPQTKSFGYDSLGRQNLVQEGDLQNLTLYDDLDRPIEEKKQSISGQIFNRITHEYGQNWESTSHYIHDQKQTEIKVFDSFRRLISKTDPLGSSEAIQYTSQREKIHTDPLQLQTIETLDSHGRIKQIEKRKGKLLSLSEKFYTPNGKPQLQKDTIYAPDGTSRQVTIRWEYDSRGRTSKLIEADQKITTYQYEADGKLSKTTKPDGIEIHYLYDSLRHLTRLTSSDGTVDHTIRSNKLGQLLETDGIQRTVDHAGRLTSEIWPENHLIQTLYDTQGRKKEIQIPHIQCTIHYEYDAAHLISVTRKQNQHILYTHRYTRYDADHLTEQTLIGGLGKCTWTLDPLLRPHTLSSPHFQQQIDEYDHVGNICQMKIQDHTVTYTYDDLYQLTSENGPFPHRYTYDTLYNRLSKDEEQYQINPLNQVVSHFEYDQNGNPIKYGNTIYRYDALDRLIHLETPDCIQTFTYDSLHRCRTKTTQNNSSKKTLYFLYDGQNEIGSLDETFQIQELRILGLTPHAEIGSAIAIELGLRYYAPIHDLQGNIAALLPLRAGEEPSIYLYSAFGEEILTGPTHSPWRFSSKRTDSGLVNYGRRFYIPSLGRWLTPDPSGFTDGMNLYAFLHNDPLTHLDDYGLWSFSSNSTSSNQSSLLGFPTIYTSQQQSQRPNFNEYPYSAKITPLRPLNPSSQYAPIYFFSGIQNKPKDTLSGARALMRTLGPHANVIPVHVETSTLYPDFRSVWIQKQPGYTDEFIRSFARRIQMDQFYNGHVLRDDRKTFLSGFSRGAGGTIYNILEHVMPEMRQRFIVLTAGATRFIPNNLGSLVVNLVSTGDKACYHCNPGFKKHPERFENNYNIITLPKKEWHLPEGDHRWESQTYQDGIKDRFNRIYEENGAPK